MDFLSHVAQQHRIPRPVVKDAAMAVFMLLERFGKPDEVAQLVREMPLARQLLGVPRGPNPAIVAWIAGLVAVVATGPRSIKESLKATGLRDNEIVPFVSDLVQHLQEQVDPAFVAQLVGRVPGLSRLAALPQANEAEE